MKIRKATSKLSIIFLISVVLTGCFNFGKKDGNEEEEKTTQNEDAGYISLVRDTNSLIEDYTYVFTNGGMASYSIVGKDNNGNDIENVDAFATWRVEDSDILSVDSSGTVTGKKNGTTKLIAKYGNYTAEVDVQVATIAKNFSLKEELFDYRMDGTYFFPLNMDSLTSSVWYEFSNENIIALDSTPNKFKVIGEGTVEVSATAYTDWQGNKETINFTIDTLNKNAPVFYVNNVAKTSGTCTIAKNKYSSIPFSDCKITAKSNNTNVTDTISVYEGNYSLTRTGTYKITLMATYGGYVNYFKLTLEVEDYEVIRTLSPIDAIQYSTVTLNTQKSGTYSYDYAVKLVSISIQATLNSQYEYAEADLTFYASYSIQKWSTSTVVNKSPSKKVTITKTSPRTVTITIAISDNSTYDLRTLTKNGYVTFGGYCYSYRYY